MVVKRDFDKVLVNLLRKNPSFVNIALIDAEGIPISFAVKSRQFQIKPATLGSKSKVLLYLSKSFSNSINITDPIIQVFFFEKVVLLIVNLKVVNFFIMLDLKGWPADGKLLYETFLEVKNLLSQVDTSQDETLKALFEGDRREGVKIADVSDNFLKVIAKNINSLNQIQVDSIKTQKPSISDHSGYFTQKFTNKIIIEGLVLNDANAEIFKVENTHSNFKDSINNLLKDGSKELETFNLGAPILILNIFEKSEVLLLTKLGDFGKGNSYCGILMENRLGTLTEIMKLIYQVSLDLKTNEELRALSQCLELIGYSVEDLSAKSEKALSLQQYELSELLLERAANSLINQDKFSEAGKFHSKLGDALKKQGENEKAEQQYLIATELHLKERNYEGGGDEYIKLGQLAYVSKDLPNALDYFYKAEKYYKNGGNDAKFKKAEETIRKVTLALQNILKDYLSGATGESIPFSLLEKKLNISEDILVRTFKGLFERNEISGQINLIKKRYTKKKVGSTEAIVGEDGATGKLYELPQMNKAALIQKQRKIESGLANIEDIFEKINFPFEQYIKYQNSLTELNFLEQKSKIYSSNLETNQCVICTRTFTKQDEISDCGNGHYYHYKCIKLWIENQKNCPACDVNLLDNLKVMFLDTIEAKDDALSLGDIVATLKLKINNLESEINKREEQIYLMKEYSEKDKSVFEKLMVERDSKHMLEKEIKKNSRIIQELRSLLEIIKK